MRFVATIATMLVHINVSIIYQCVKSPAGEKISPAFFVKASNIIRSPLSTRFVISEEILQIIVVP